MKLTPWYLAAVAPLVVAGCTGAFLGHMAVLAVVLSIFIGTLSLGHVAPLPSVIPVGSLGTLGGATIVTSGMISNQDSGDVSSAAVDSPVLHESV